MDEHPTMHIALPLGYGIWQLLEMGGEGGVHLIKAKNPAPKLSHYLSKKLIATQLALMRNDP